MYPINDPTLCSSHRNAQADAVGKTTAAIGILLVVIGHSTGLLPVDAIKYAQVSRSYSIFLSVIDWIYSFHMPLFLFIAGLNYEKYTKPKKECYWSLVDSKAKRLLVPYMVVSSLAYPIKVSLSRFALRPIPFSGTSYIESLLHPWNNTIIYFWFLPTLFLIFLATPILDYLARRIPTSAAGALVLVLFYYAFPHKSEDFILSFLNCGGALHNSIFFFLGIVAVKYLDFSGIPSWAAWLFLPIITLYLFKSPITAFESFGFPLAILGILSIVVFGKTEIHKSKVLNVIGERSFQIYLFSWFPLIGVRIVGTQLCGISIGYVVIASIGLGIALPIIATGLLDRWIPKSWRFIYGN